MISDTDECLTLNTCEAKCINTYGSFTCDCNTGYQLVNQTHCEGKTWILSYSKQAISWVFQGSNIFIFLKLTENSLFLKIPEGNKMYVLDNTHDNELL